MKKLLTILLILFIILLVILFFRIKDRDEEFSLYTRTWTKAVCNESHCIEMFITCNETNLVDITPVSDLIDMEENWNDSRPLEILNKWC